MKYLISDQSEVLHPECNIIIEFFIENKMFVNHDLFQAILLDKQKSILLTLMCWASYE